MQRQSPPNHRHDGTSPLPLGMDWSPPPKRLAGGETVWPHDPHTGWSYCVTIPSWVVLAKSKDSDPVVFYRVLVSIQSPEGITTTRDVPRRFNDFLKFLAVLKRIFPRKNLPPAPPKGFLRMKTKTQLEERRSALEEWMTKLLSDIDVSRSVAAASFFELEAAARSSFQDQQQTTAESSPVNGTVSPLQVPSTSLSAVAGSSSVASDYGSDTAYEASDIGSPRLERGNTFELGTEDLLQDEDLTNPIDKSAKYGMSHINEGLFMEESILEKLGSLPSHKIHYIEKAMSNGSASKSLCHSVDTTEIFSEPELRKIIHHARELSVESAGTNVNSQRGNELSNSAFPNSFGDVPVEISEEPEGSRTIEIFENGDLTLPDDVHLVLPSDQRYKMHRVLTTMQRRLVTAKTDMEDLISRLNQETAVKDYLTTKVKDLEVELEATKQKSKEHLEQAVLIERERVTQMQWDMEELRRKSMEMELKLNLQQDKVDNNSTRINIIQEKDELQQELTAKKWQLDELLKQHQELELKSKADIKVLIKEVKSLRSSQLELKQQLGQSFRERAEIERHFEQERQSIEQSRNILRKLLHEYEILQQRFEECKINIANEDEDNLLMNFPSPPDALDLLTTSDNQIDFLLTEVQHLIQGFESIFNDDANNIDIDTRTIIKKLSNMLANMYVNKGKLRKRVNSGLRYALEMKMCSQQASEHPSGEIVQNEQLDQ